MAYRVGPPWFRRMLALVGMLVPFGFSIVFLPASTPQFVIYGVWAVSALIGMYLFGLFGVKPMSHG